MSRSYRKMPICGMATRASEKQDKARAHRQFRHHVKVCLLNGKEPPRYLREVSNVYGFEKDGKQYFSVLEESYLLRK